MLKLIKYVLLFSIVILFSCKKSNYKYFEKGFKAISVNPNNENIQLIFEKPTNSNWYIMSVIEVDGYNKMVFYDYDRDCKADAVEAFQRNDRNSSYYVRIDYAYRKDAIEELEEIFHSADRVLRFASREMKKIIRNGDKKKNSS